MRIIAHQGGKEIATHQLWAATSRSVFSPGNTLFT